MSYFVNGGASPLLHVPEFSIAMTPCSGPLDTDELKEKDFFYLLYVFPIRLVTDLATVLAAYLSWTQLLGDSAGVGGALEDMAAALLVRPFVPVWVALLHQVWVSVWLDGRLSLLKWPPFHTGLPLHGDGGCLPRFFSDRKHPGLRLPSVECPSD